MVGHANFANEGAQKVDSVAGGRIMLSSVDIKMIKSSLEDDLKQRKRNSSHI